MNEAKGQKFREEKKLLPDRPTVLGEDLRANLKALTEDIPGGLLRGDIPDSDRDPEEEKAVIERLLRVKQDLLDSLKLGEEGKRALILEEIEKLESRYDYFNERLA